MWDSKGLIRKGRDRHLFLFDFYLLFSKEIKDNGKSKYIYKHKLMVSSDLMRRVRDNALLRLTQCK